MKKGNDETKAFIRLLKETGLYAEWTKNRKYHCMKTSVKKKEYLNFGIYAPTLGNFISSSFVWIDTDNNAFWMKLAIKYPCDMKPSEILCDKDALEVIKKLMEENFKII